MRRLVSASMLVLLTACTAQTSSLPLPDSGLTREERLAIRFDGADVTAAGLATQTIGRTIREADVQRAVTTAAARSLSWNAGTRDAVVRLTVTRVEIARPDAVPLPGALSLMEGEVALFDAATGMQIGATVPLSVNGEGWRIDGLQGEALARERRLELTRLAFQFTAVARRALLGG
ncbi:hypothetical protein [Roseobacter sp. HKCCA0434]|uniref:hypothetical protein n=1 Tax=Roseobacter sp. HKCCA0434 TaxID=3079297 RepID=UPI002905BBD2|nr:hypothetical protein [Roseobacter sp. HKCCA0434]